MTDRDLYCAFALFHREFRRHFGNDCIVELRQVHDGIWRFTLMNAPDMKALEWVDLLSEIQGRIAETDRTLSGFFSLQREFSDTQSRRSRAWEG